MTDYSAFQIIDATDLPPINVGIGGLGIGAPPSAMAGYGVPQFFNTGVNADAGQPQGLTLPGNLTAATGATPAAPSSGGSVNPGATDTKSAGIQGTLQDYFLRIVVIITGFIFLAIGLNMFREGKT